MARDPGSFVGLFESEPERLGFHQVEEPRLGDVILFGVHSQRVNHCAVYMGDGRMAHHLPGRLSVVENIGAWAPKVLRTMRRAA